MSEKTGIEWATHTASPWFGCSKVSAGCTNCYAEFLTLQKGWAGWGDNAPRVRSKGFWKDAYRFNRKAEDSVTAGFEKPRMFTSLMDWLDPKAPTEWLSDFLKVIHDCQNLDWLLLTKRPELFKQRIVVAAGQPSICGTPAGIWAHRWWCGDLVPQNVWFGVTMENQEQVVKRWDALRSIPARIKWASCEPLLEPLKLSMTDSEVGTVYNYLGKGGLNWIVVGGESGKNRRDCGVEAIESIVGQCSRAGVPCFVKQDCAFKPGQQGRIPDEIWKVKQYPQ